MIPVKRNGVFQYTEKLEPNDIKVEDKPHEFAELDEFDQWKIDIEKIKQAKIQKLKLEISPQLIYVKAPEYKQVNSALGIYTEEKKTEIVNWIQLIRKLTDSIETEINGLTEIEKVEAFNIDFETLKELGEKND